MNLKRRVLNKQILYIIFVISLLPVLYLFFDNNSVKSFWYKIANITGYLGGVILFWQFFLGIRGVVKRFTSDYDWSIKIHTFLGVFGALFVFAHPILESMIYLRDLRFIFGINFSSSFETQISYGRIAFILFLVVWITSSLFRKKYTYRTWLYVHYLSYPLFFFTLIHPFTIGSYLQNNPVIYYYWVLLCALSAVFVFIKLLDVFNISFSKYKLIEVNQFDGGVYTLKYIPLGKKIIPNPGEYFYIKNNYFGEAHPFSILEFNEDTGELIFGIKDLGRYTHELSLSKSGEIHYLDGSFGEFTFEGFNDDPKVILAGGIGVTPFYELITRYGTEDTYMFYANSKLSTALYRDKFKKLLGSRYFDFISNEKVGGKNVICSLITTSHLKDILPKDMTNSYKFFVCGSPIFMNSIINCLKEIGVERSQIFIEEFEY